MARAAFQQELGQVAGSASWRRFLRSLAAPADATQPPGQGPSPAHNDYLWGAFFATGTGPPGYLDSLVAQCRFLTAHSAKASQRQLFYDTGRSAVWSLKSNAHQDSTVARYLQNPAVRQRLDDVATQYQKINPR